eukprot:4496521-Alexandrium_andersonii.AAC.1
MGHPPHAALMQRSSPPRGCEEAGATSDTWQATKLPPCDLRRAPKWTNMPLVEAVRPANSKRQLAPKRLTARRSAAEMATTQPECAAAPE